MIDVFAEPSDLVSREFIERVSSQVNSIATVIEESEGVAFGEVTLVVVGLQRIRDLHKAYFGDSSPTDVITFPGDSDATEGLIDGDIVVCLDVAMEQANEAGHTACREVNFLATHGLLHLCGWVDSLDSDRDEMLRRQEELIQIVDQRSASE